MLTRLLNISATVAQAIKILLSAATKYLIGDGFYESAEIKAGKNPDGVGVVRFGPPKLGAHVCLIQPSCEPQAIYDQLKQIMNLENIDARHTYACVNFITGSDFFLSMHDSTASDLRKKLIRHFDLNKLYTLSISLTEQVLHDISLKKLDSSHKNLHMWFEGDIKKTIFRLFAHGLCGFDLDSDFSKIEQMIENLEKLPNNILIFHVFFTQLAEGFYPTLRKMRNGYDGIITQFIKEQITSLQQHDQESINKNIFISRIAAMYPDKSLQELNIQDIECIAKDREIRMTISGLLAINNITRLILGAIKQFCLTMENVFYDRLLEEIHTSYENKKSCLHKDKMPLLHAFYLEMLRHQPPMPAISRYTNESMHIGSQTIPANTIIIFDLKKALLKCGGEAYNPLGFYPERYLTTDGTLNKLAKNSQQVLLPFGAGARMCPAMAVSEMVFKTYLIAIIQDAHKIRLLAEPTPSNQISVKKEKENVSTLPPDISPTFAEDVLRYT